MHAARMAAEDVPFGPKRRDPGRWIGAAFGMLWLLIPVVDMFQSDPPAAHVVLGLGGLAAFTWLYMARVMRWRCSDRDAILTVIAMGAIATVLTLFERQTWALLFVYTAAAGGLRLPPRLNATSVAVSTVLCGVTLLMAGADDGTVISITATTVGIGALFVALGGVIRANIELRAARAELAELAVPAGGPGLSRGLRDLPGHDRLGSALEGQHAGGAPRDRPGGASAHHPQPED